MNLSESSFDFIDCSMTRQCMMNGCWTMDQTGLWQWLTNYKVDHHNGFMFANEPEITVIVNIMESAQAPIQVAHSGASFGFTMCNLDYIAKNGFEAYKELYLRNKLQREQEQEQQAQQTAGNE